MSADDATRFFDTSGCLNLSRPGSGSRRTTVKPQNRPRITSSIPIRGQPKIDLYNFDHIDFADSKYVLTSPRSLQACARLNIKPAELLPRKLADITSDKIRFSTLMDVRDEMEIDRLGKLQRCREEREKIIREKALDPSSTEKPSDPKITMNSDRPVPQRQTQTRFQLPRNDQLPPRPTASTRPKTASSALKQTVTQWTFPDDQNQLRTSSSTDFLNDVRRMDKTLQRIGTSDKSQRYVNGLENVKHIIEQRTHQTASDHELENLTFEKKQYELLLSHYDHELKIQKARENARRAEKEKEAERYETLMHDHLDQTMAEERRQSELRRKLDKLHHSRQLYDALQAKNHELQMADVQKRRLELLNEIKRKDRRTQHFVKDKQEAANLSRTIAKSSQDTRTYLRETKENFDEKAKKAELTTNILVTKAKLPVNRRHLQSSLQT